MHNATAAQLALNWFFKIYFQKYSPQSCLRIICWGIIAALMLETFNFLVTLFSRWENGKLGKVETVAKAPATFKFWLVLGAHGLPSFHFILLLCIYRQTLVPWATRIYLPIHSLISLQAFLLVKFGKWDNTGSSWLRTWTGKFPFGQNNYNFFWRNYSSHLKNEPINQRWKGNLMKRSRPNEYSWPCTIVSQPS